MASTRVSAILRLSSLFCLCLLLLFTGSRVDARTDAEGAAADVEALLEFKKHITHDPYSRLKDWNSNSSTACLWTAVNCSTKHPGRVVHISLADAALQGRLSPQVANVSFLQVLDLFNNSLSGQIPSSLGRLHRFKRLDLCVNFFEGVIPPQIGNLSSLKLLYLCANSLNSQVPHSLAALKNLSEFTVYQNILTGQIPSWLGTLHKLEYLDVGYNSMVDVIPVQLGNLSLIQYLNLEQNYLVGSIPISLCSLNRLKLFSLALNKLTGTLPKCLGNLTALRVLDFSFNNLQGHLPSWVGNLHKLQQLAFTGNKFAGRIPVSWANLTQIHVLELSLNRFTGTLPSWLGRVCSQLQDLNLGENYFTSGLSSSSQPIPFLESVSNCSGLTRLKLYHNLLTGTLPSHVGNNWPNLQKLMLGNNFISGNIPKSIGNFSYVFVLKLSDNLLSGTVPKEISNLKSIQGIFLQSNKLSGEIPVEISLLNQTLEYLHLHNNTLSGSIPASIEELVYLRGLHLHQNLLSGQIPSEIGKCHVLEDLRLSINNLSGVIPPEVAGLKGIMFHFDLSRNRLSGEVPPDIAGLKMAQFINLSSNQLSGNIALYIDSWLDARQINLSFNNFSGNISKSIGNKLTQLQSIDLSHNNFTGSVPASLFNLSFLYFLNFSCNYFDEEIPCVHPSSKRLRLSRWSFLGNPNLCGGCFDLKACQGPGKHHSSHSNESTILKIVLSMVGGLLLLVVTGILLVLFRSIKPSEAETPRINEKFLKLSVEEVRTATDNFSASNLVGAGKHGKVYRGVLRSGQVVAIKRLSCENQRATEKSFRKECRALANVRHRNILKIITVVWTQELKAIVTPFMSNGSLHSLLRGRQNDGSIPIMLTTRLRLLRELATALSYLHHYCSFPIIHCDVKPENVLLDDEMTVKLADFGIASLTGNFDHSTLSSSSSTGVKGSIGYIAPGGNFDHSTLSSSSSTGVKGSIGYIAPEYGIGKRMSAKGDVYSFGVVTLEVITRLKPTDEMFHGHITLPHWISMALRGKSGEERTHMLKAIISRANEDSGGIEIDKEEELLVLENILTIGLRCTCQDPSLRPDMKEVESMLHSLDIGDQRKLSCNLEEVIRLVESQPPLIKRNVESSTFSDP